MDHATPERDEVESLTSGGARSSSNDLDANQSRLLSTNTAEQHRYAQDESRRDDSVSVAPSKLAQHSYGDTQSNRDTRSSKEEALLLLSSRSTPAATSSAPRTAQPTEILASAQASPSTSAILASSSTDYGLAANVDSHVEEQHWRTSDLSLNTHAFQSRFFHTPQQPCSNMSEGAGEGGESIHSLDTFDDSSSSSSSSCTHRSFNSPQQDTSNLDKLHSAHRNNCLVADTGAAMDSLPMHLESNVPAAKIKEEGKKRGRPKTDQDDRRSQEESEILLKTMHDDKMKKKQSESYDRKQHSSELTRRQGGVTPLLGSIGFERSINKMIHKRDSSVGDGDADSNTGSPGQGNITSTKTNDDHKDDVNHMSENGDAITTATSAAVAEEDDANSTTTSESRAQDLAIRGSKYDYDMNWDMIGQRHTHDLHVEPEQLEQRRGQGWRDVGGLAGSGRRSDDAVMSKHDLLGALPPSVDVRDSSVPFLSSASPPYVASILGNSDSFTRLSQIHDGGSAQTPEAEQTLLHYEQTDPELDNGEGDMVSISTHPCVPRRRARSTPTPYRSQDLYSSAPSRQRNRRHIAYQYQRYNYGVSDETGENYNDVSTWDDEDAIVAENEPIIAIQNNPPTSVSSSSQMQISENTESNQDSNVFDDFTATPVFPRSAGLSHPSTSAVAADDKENVLELSRVVPSVRALSPTAATETASDMNESVNTISNESVATGSSSSSTSSLARRRRRFGRGTGLQIPSEPNGSSGRSFPSLSSTTDSSSSQQLRLATQNNRTTSTRNGAGSSIPGVESSSSRSLLSSLDAGMAAMRRWVRSRTAATASAAQAGPRPSRAALHFQRQNETERLSMQLGEEDFFALSNAGDPRRLTSQSDNESRIGGSERDIVFGGWPRYPPPIEEEDELTRQRAFSEPDVNRVRAWFFSRRNASASDMEVPVGPSQVRISRRRRRSGRLRDVNSDYARTAESATPISAPTMSSSTESDIVGSHVASSASRSSLHLYSTQSLQHTEDEMDHSGILGRGPTMLRLALQSVSNNSSTSGSGGAEERGTRNEANNNPDENERAPGPVPANAPANDPNRRARSRWILINRRFQLIITFVALVFSLLLFGILVCWVVLTSAYVVSIDKDCDVPLKHYYWLATFQLILDVFRTDIMRFLFRWDATSGERIPARVVIYNMGYLTYAMLVLRMGVRCVFLTNESTCAKTAPELFKTSNVFVSLSLAAWSTIIFGYLCPFCFVAMILTRNGYSPSIDINGREGSPNGNGAINGVFPSAYSNNSAPPECIDQLSIVLLEEFPDEYPKDCCICMGDFVAGEVIVATECEHVFHKRCCQEWLRQARTCPVCRTDIPEALIARGRVESVPNNTLARRETTRGINFSSGPFRREDLRHEVVNLLRILRHRDRGSERNNPTTDDIEMGVQIPVMSRNRSSLSQSTSHAAARMEQRQNSGQTAPPRQ